MFKKINLILILLMLSSCNSLDTPHTYYSQENGQWRWYISSTNWTGNGRFIYLKGIDNESFQIINFESAHSNGLLYAKDKNNVYFRGEILKDADPKTFEVLHKDGYAKDKDNVYLDHDKIIYANPKTFEVLGSLYAKDDTYIFSGTLPMFVKEIDEFKVTDIDGLKSTTYGLDSFIEDNPEYKFLDTLNLDKIVTGWGKGETKTEKFDSFKRIEPISANEGKF